MKLSLTLLAGLLPSVAAKATHKNKNMARDVDLSNVQIRADSKTGGSLLSKARRLDDGEEEFTWIAGYSLRFNPCTSSEDYYGGQFNGDEYNGQGYYAYYNNGDGQNNGNYQNGQNGYNGDYYGNDQRADYAGMYQNRLVHFSLCPSDSCWRCKNGAEYVVTLNDFVDAALEARMTALEYNCERVRENCYCENASSEEQCLYNCFKNAKLEECADNMYDGEFDVQEAVECVQLEVEDEDAVKNYIYSNTDKSFWRDVYWMQPGSAPASEYLKAVGTAIDMGAAMDPKLLKAGVEAHHKAIGSGLGKACSQADFEAINAALGRMIASVPEGKVMAVYDAFSKLVSSDVPPYLMSTVKEADARAAYSALMEFKDVVKANPITPAAVSAPSNAQIDAAAGKLSAAAYPFLKDIDWSSDLSLTPPGGVATPKAVLGAIDKALVMGAAMDGGALKEAALAHVKAIGSVDASGVTTQADFAAINAGLGKAIASVPASKVMDVYNAFGKVVSADVPNYLIRTVNAGDARAAYSALMEFKDVVKASR